MWTYPVAGKNNERHWDEIVNTHRTFWEKDCQEDPLILLCVASPFPLSQYPSLTNILAVEKELNADCLVGIEYAGDYERQFSESMSLPGTGIWAARPIPGVPWIEGIMGCRIVSMGSELWACQSEGASWKTAAKQRNTDWIRKYLEFAEVLNGNAVGRYAVAQSIIRGPSDVAAAMVGGTDLVMDLVDRAEEVLLFFEHAADEIVRLVERQRALVSPFYEGYVMGGFGIWCPDKCLVFQEDATAILSPSIYRDVLCAVDGRLSSSFPYTGMHTHSSSLFLVKDILRLESLDVVQITCDCPSKDLDRVIDASQEILLSKCLLLSGTFSVGQVERLCNELDPRGLDIQILVSSSDCAEPYRCLV